MSYPQQSESKLGQPAQVGYPLRWKALILLCVANFMIILDAQIVILALPSVEKGLKMSAAFGQWVLSGYLLSFGGLLLFGGRLADLLGRRRMFLTGVLLFLLSSLLCGVSWSGGVLITARVVQGVSAAMMAPAALSILMTLFVDGTERNKALAYWSGVGGVGATAALLVGGAVTGSLGWQWIFLLNVPVAVVMLFFGGALLPESRSSDGQHTLDLAGAVTITFSLVLLIGAVVTGPTNGWTSGKVLAMIFGAILLGALFVVIESRSKEPLISLHIFASRVFVGGTLTIGIMTMIAWGFGFALSSYAQDVLGYSPLKFGLCTTVMTVMTIVGAYGAQLSVTKFGIRATAAASMVLMGAGSLLLTRISAHGNYFGDVFWGLLLIGPGIGGGPVAAISAAMSSVREDMAGAVSGVNTTAFQIGAGLGTAIVSSVIISRAGSSSLPAVLTKGYQAGFMACVVFAAVGLVAGLILFRPARRDAQVSSS